MNAHHYIAFDLGAESGRVMLGTLADGRLSVEEIHRFPNGPVSILGTLRWDVLRIFEELKTGIRAVAARNVPVASVSCDSWGVDYVLLHGGEPLLSAPFHYRDPRTDGGLDRAFRRVPADEIFAETGIQFMALNTLYQFQDDLQNRSAVFAAADLFLNIGDYFNYLFSGVARAEESMASTTQMYDPVRRQWSWALIDKFGFPRRIYPQIVPSGSVLGPLRGDAGADKRMGTPSVVAGCSHDTAAAVAAVPAEGDGWAYLSSGTWSLLGVERPAPVISALSRAYNVTNEVGYGRSIRLLKNIVGLWIEQECRRSWGKEGHDFTHEALMHKAGSATPFRAFIDPTDPGFLRPEGMPEKVASYCRATGQLVPTTHGEIIRCALESLALLYRKTLEQLEKVTGDHVTTLHIVGGGAKNELLNQWTANALGRTVIAGPAECTAIGNVLIQAMALGHIPSHAAGREIVRRSFPAVRYEPGDAAAWEEAYRQFNQISRKT